MSGLFGVFDRNGEPASAEILQNMHEAMSYWQSDTSGILREGTIGFGHTMLWNTPESRLENLPNKQDQLVITMDARLDNREELAHKLGMTKHPLDQITDSDFILAAYQKWSEDCPKNLLGDFAFVIWDESRKQLFCARDHIGIKQFYYHIEKERFVFSNDIRGLIPHPNISNKIKDEAVAIYLTIGELWHPSITFFDSIQKLPPASSMIITSTRAIQTIYWKAEDSPRIKLNSVKEYSDKLRELLEESVHTRLRSEAPIASHLSGGLDSSTIAVLAARKLRKKNKLLQVYNWVAAPKAEDDPEYYEWANSRQIAELENIEHYYIDLNAEQLSDIFFNHDIALNDTVDLWYEFQVRHEAKKKNVQTILSGWGGDELITYKGQSYYSDIFWRGKRFLALKTIFQDTRDSPQPWKSFLSLCYYKIFLPGLPQWSYRYFPKTNYETFDFLKCANPDFVKFAQSKKPFRALISEKTTRKDQLNRLKQGHIINRIESWASSAFSNKIEYSYPLLDKRIVEFSLGIPAEMYLQEGKSRFLFRHAITGILPENIRWGNFKQEPFRLKLLEAIEKKAIHIWLNKTKTLTLTNPYIDRVLLQKEIELMASSTESSLEERFQLLDNIEKSILALNLAKGI